MTKYDVCEYCHGPVTERKVSVDHRWRRQLILVRQVPVGVCRRCGERYYKAAVLRKLDMMAQGKIGTIRRISVPVADFRQVAYA